MNYDAVMCVGKHHIDIGIKSIRSLLLFTEAGKIFVVSPRPVLDSIKHKIGGHNRIRFIDEDHVIDPTAINDIREKFTKRAGSDSTFGWYYQQFLKMSVCELPELSDYYLIWDADTVLLKALSFFDKDGKPFIAPSAEHHKPYFQLTNKVLGFDRQVKFSFISEHLMVKKEYMKLLLSALATHAPPDTSWIEFIIDSIDVKNIHRSGFSEYETYGNFIALKFNDSFTCRKIKSTRYGSKRYGNKPDQYAFFGLMRFGYTYATFEAWHKPSKLKLKIKAYALRALWNYHCRTSRCSEQIKAATELGR